LKETRRNINYLQTVTFTYYTNATNVAVKPNPFGFLVLDTTVLAPVRIGADGPVLKRGPDNQTVFLFSPKNNAA